MGVEMGTGGGGGLPPLKQLKPLCRRKFSMKRAHGTLLGLACTCGWAGAQRRQCFARFEGTEPRTPSAGRWPMVSDIREHRPEFLFSQRCSI